jgi:hypothetical protein
MNTQNQASIKKPRVGFNPIGRLLPGLSLAALLAMALLAGCAVIARAIQTPAPDATLIPTLVLDTIAPSLTVTPADTPVCAYVEASKDAPEASSALTQAYRSADFANVDVRAEAYGENCIDTNTNRVASFSARQTDIYLSVPVQDIHDTQALGDWISRLVPVINLVPADQLPGPNPGNIAIQFTSAADTVNLWFPRQTAQGLIQKGLRGSALYEALATGNTQ